VLIKCIYIYGEVLLFKALFTWWAIHIWTPCRALLHQNPLQIRPIPLHFNLNANYLAYRHFSLQPIVVFEFMHWIWEGFGCAMGVTLTVHSLSLWRSKMYSLSWVKHGDHKKITICNVEQKLKHTLSNFRILSGNLYHLVIHLRQICSI